ncbi:hypothetical protein EG857_14970 [Enterococcus faecalis]|nr:hypothetical protein EG877_16595 [Enterococcus faecalis]RXF27333.1 hypothetical protein EG857_14970 [Enterococcus faecalis]
MGRERAGPGDARELTHTRTNKQPDAMARFNARSFIDSGRAGASQRGPAVVDARRHDDQHDG